MTLKKIFGTMLALAGLVGAAYAGDDTEIVKQGDTTVTLADVDGFLQQMPENQREGYLSSSARVQQMLIGILRDKQLANQAVAMKLDQDPHVQAEIAFARDRILSRRRVNAYEASLQVPSMEVAAKEQYLAHKTDYVVPEIVDVQHVLISEKGRSDADAKALAEKVRSEAMADPRAFDQLVQKYSEDPSKASNQGQIRDATSAKLVGEFTAAAKKLTKVDEISPVVKTSYGYHVLKLIQRTPAKPQEFVAVKDQLVAKLKENYVAEQRKTFFAKLDEGRPSVNSQGMEALQERYKLGAMPSISEAVKSAESNK
ncbi:peptidylprolyl isomerase [Rudaea sp.]|uniref:peptidylprolyl isomerase n=1 Tax=Rudaea sp. TaxID=2136325 RepID=UPI002ED2ED98